MMKSKSTPVRRVPVSLKEASQLAMAGNWVDISSLVPVSDGKFRREEAAFQAEVQYAFDALTETARSSEYSGFLKTVEPELEHITGLTVVSDLEFVVVFRCDNEMFADFDQNPRYIYLPDPYICRIYQALMKRGNDLVFWTSALRFILTEIKAVLPDDIAGAPSVCREDFWQIVCIFMKRANEEISDHAAMQELRSVYAAFSDPAYRRGLAFFSQQEFLHDFVKQQKVVYAARNKIPILFADPARGVFIDDNIDYIKSAVAAHWPKKRTIHLDPGIFSLQRAREMIDGLCRIVPASRR
jgi:hypothetical protein